MNKPFENFGRRWIALGALVIGLICVLQSSAYAGYIAEQAWFVGTSDTMKLSDVKALAEQRFAGALFKGYGTDPIWVRLRINPAQAPDKPGDKLYLRIRPAYLDSIELFDPLQSTAAPPATGDLVPLNVDFPSSPALLIGLPASDQPRDVWLRIQTNSSRIAYFEVLDADDLKRADDRFIFVGAAFMGCIVIFLMWGTMLLIIERGSFWIVFVLIQIVSLIFSSSYLGFTRLWLGLSLPPSLIDASISVGAGAYTWTGILLGCLLLREFQMPKWGGTLLAFMLCIFPMELILMIAGKTSLSMQINTSLVMLATVGLVIVAHLSCDKPPVADGLPQPLTRTMVLLYFWVTMVITLSGTIALLGLAYVHPIAMYFTLFYATFSGILMLAMLQYRSIKLRLMQKQLSMNVEAARQRIEQEQHFRAEKDKFLSMLTHEMKTPMATMRMLLANGGVPETISGGITRSIKTMSDLLERSTHTSNVEDGELTVSPETFNSRVLIEAVLREGSSPERVHISSGSDDACLHTDPFLLGVIVKNLIDNALKYSPPGSIVTFGIDDSEEAHLARIEIANLPGQAGWPDPEKIFSKYYRSPKARHKTGSGLGLYLAHGLAAAIGAELKYVPDEQHVRFRLMLLKAKKV